MAGSGDVLCRPCEPRAFVRVDREAGSSPSASASVVSSHAQAANAHAGWIRCTCDTTVTSSQDSKTTSPTSEYVDVLSGKKQGRRHCSPTPGSASILTAINRMSVLCRAVARRIPTSSARSFPSRRTTAGYPLDFPRAAHESNRALVHVPGRQVRDLVARSCPLRPVIISVMRRVPETRTSAQVLAIRKSTRRASITFNESSCEKSKEPKGCRKAIEANRVLCEGVEGARRIRASPRAGVREGCAR